MGTMVQHARNPGLEAQVYSTPEDAEAWRVYADWLQEVGDPWGEYLALSLAAEQAQAESATEPQGQLTRDLALPLVAEQAQAKSAKELQAQLKRYRLDFQDELYGPRLAALIEAEKLRTHPALRWVHGQLLELAEPGPVWEAPRPGAGFPPWKRTRPEQVLAALEGSRAARLLRLGPELRAREALRVRVPELLSERLAVFEHEQIGSHWFMHEDPQPEVQYEGELWGIWQARGELICEHEASFASFSCYGDWSMRATAYPEFEAEAEAEFIAACVYHSFDWYSDHPHCGWYLDVRRPPLGGWTEMIRVYAHCSDEASAEDVFPRGDPGPIERVTAIIDDGNTRVFAVRAAQTWLTFEFETS